MIDQRWERNVTRRGFVAAGAATAFLAACGGSTDTADEDKDSGDKAEGAAKLTGTLHYYNWADYVNPETYKNFTAETGVKIKKDFFVSNE
jgi:spermidine/putrescine-binding protein